MITNQSPVHSSLISLIRDIYGTDFVPLHRPIFDGNENHYLSDCIDSNFVSSVGLYVNKFMNYC